MRRTFGPRAASQPSAATARRSARTSATTARPARTARGRTPSSASATEATSASATARGAQTEVLRQETLRIDGAAGTEADLAPPPRVEREPGAEPGPVARPADEDDLQPLVLPRHVPEEAVAAAGERLAAPAGREQEV